MELFDAKEGRVGEVIPMPVVALYAVDNRLTHSLESSNRNIIQIKQNITIYFVYMLDHPITVVLNVFDTLKNNGLKVYKFMSIKTQEDHIGHIKQSKSDRFQDR